ncbi:unnamed protein product [marine sediment metagenome]|uniref:Uncharacterized protein n=1 Tax=marine sediment metagenome TaxID=412755 RepID=X0TYB6_9ZZZZ
MSENEIEKLPIILRNMYKSYQLHYNGLKRFEERLLNIINNKEIVED